MASSLSDNNSTCINGDDSYRLILSLLEETCSSEEYNDERLNNMIRSLEAEIINAKNTVHTMEEHSMELPAGMLSIVVEKNDVEFMDGQDCSSSLEESSTNDLEFDVPAWDADVEHQSASSSSWSDDDDVKSCMDFYGDDEMVDISEYGFNHHDDYYQLCYGVPLENHGDTGLYVAHESSDCFGLATGVKS